MSKVITPYKKYGNFTKEDEKDARRFFSYANPIELESGIAWVKKFFSNEEIDEEEELKQEDFF